MAFQKKFFWTSFLIALGLEIVIIVLYNALLYRIFGESSINVILIILAPLVWLFGYLVDVLNVRARFGPVALYSLIWIAILAYPLKKLFFEEREVKWWHYVLGVIILQVVIAAVAMIVISYALKDLNIGF